MDKASTVDPASTIGIDLGDVYSHVCVLDAQGEVVERFRLPSSRVAFETRFRHRLRARVVIEVGTRSPWVSRLLRSMGHDVIVANARKIPANPSKTDEHDAEFLARLGRHDVRLLYPIEHREETQQVHLGVVRARDMAVRARTKLINCVRGTVKAMGYEIPACIAERFVGQSLEHVPQSLLPALSPLIRLVGEISIEIEAYDAEIERLARDVYPTTALLRQVHGVGPITALGFVLVLGSPDRIRSSRSVGAYLGLVPAKRQSGEIDPQLGITKRGDKLLRRLLVLSAHSILRKGSPDTDLRRAGRRLADVGGKAARKRAVIAVARRLAVLLHCLWKTAEAYEPLRNSRAAANPCAR